MRISGPISLAVAVMMVSSCDRPPSHGEILPSEVAGWRAELPDGAYDAETLYEYIDGGAEVYRALNVHSVLARRYVREGAPEILADLFLMATSADAYGAYHHDLRDGEPAGIGNESDLDVGALAFWKGPYFVSIVSLGQTQDSQAAVLKLGTRIAAAILEEGEPPWLVSVLPGEGLLTGQVRYLHTAESLARFLPLGGENPLGLGPETEVVVARYRGGETGDGLRAVLLVGYPSPAGAEGALAGLHRELAREGAGAGRAEDSLRLAGSRRIGRVLAAVLGPGGAAEDRPGVSASGESGDGLLETIAARLAERGDG